MAVSLYPSSPGLMGRPLFTTKMWMYHVPFSCTARGTDTLSSFCRLPSPKGPSVQFPYCTPSSHIRYSALELKSKSSDSVKYTFKSCHIKEKSRCMRSVHLQAHLVQGRHGNVIQQSTSELTSSSPGVNRLEPARGMVPSGFAGGVCRPRKKLLMK